MIVRCLLISTPCCHKALALRYTLTTSVDSDEVTADPGPVREAIALHMRTCRS